MQTAFEPQRPDGAQAASLEHAFGEQTMTAPVPAPARWAGAQASSGSRAAQSVPGPQVCRQRGWPSGVSTHAA